MASKRSAPMPVYRAWYYLEKNRSVYRVVRFLYREVENHAYFDAFTIYLSPLPGW